MPRIAEWPETVERVTASDCTGFLWTVKGCYALDRIQRMFPHPRAFRVAVRAFLAATGCDDIVAWSGDPGRTTGCISAGINAMASRLGYTTPVHTSDRGVVEIRMRKPI